ncbi:nuclear transport factor 2-like [Hibiscus syriacus]|nr:nuclear transport factor 2-like [Hibiscus syriacus]
MGDAKSGVCSTPQEVGAAFVDRYYLVLCNSPEEIYKFYQDSSMVSRPGPDETMTTFTTIQDIKEHLSSFDGRQLHIVSCDSQPAANQGVFVVVTGSFTTNNEQIIKFYQSFILTPMEAIHDYFISNDILKFLDEKEWITPRVSTSSSTTDLSLEEEFSIIHVSKAASSSSSHDIPVVSSSIQDDTPAVHVEDVSSVVLSPHQDVPTLPFEDVSIVVQSDASTDLPVDVSTTVVSLAPRDETTLPIEDVSTFHSKDVPIVVPTSKHEVETTPIEGISSIVSNSTHHVGPSFCMEDFPAIISNSTYRVPINHIPKKSFSSGVQVLNENDAQFKPPPVRKEPKKSGVEGENKNRNTADVKADATSIFVGNLAAGSKSEQLHQAFKKFGRIKPNGVKIKLDRLYRSYAFIQFESSSSAKVAVQASFIKIGDRKLNIKEKRSY